MGINLFAFFGFEHDTQQSHLMLCFLVLKRMGNISSALLYSTELFLLIAGNLCSVVAPPRNTIMLPPSLPFGARREYIPLTSVSQSFWRAPEQIQAGPGHLLLLVLSFSHMFTSPLLRPLFHSPSVNFAPGKRLPVYSTKERGSRSSIGTSSSYLMIIVDSLRYLTIVRFL